jgi:hypothetical protein
VTSPDRTAVAANVGSVLALALLSAVLAVIGTFYSVTWLGPVIAIVGNLAVGLGGAWATRNKYVPAVTGAAWVVVVLVFSSTGPGHDTVIPQSLPGKGQIGLIFLVAGVLTVAVCAGVATSRRWAVWMASQEAGGGRLTRRQLHPQAGPADDSERDPARHSAGSGG